MAQTKVRVPGGGNTFVVMGKDDSAANGMRVQFLANVTDKPGDAVGRATPIHPIGSNYPVEIAVPYAQGMGTLTLTFWSLWGKDGWVSAFYENGVARYSPWANYTPRHGLKVGEPVDLREVLEAQRNLGGYLFCQKFERGPKGGIARVKQYKKCVITNIDATDIVNIDTMEQKVSVTCNYAYVTTVSSALTFDNLVGRYDDISN